MLLRYKLQNRILQIFKYHDGLPGYSNYNQFDDDHQTLNLLLLAYEELLIYKDDSLYQFVFTAPPNKHDPYKRFMIAEQIRELAEALAKLQSSVKSEKTG